MELQLRRLGAAVCLLLLLTDTVLSHNVIEVFPNCNQTVQDSCLELEDVLNMTEGISNTEIILHNGDHLVSSPQGSMLYDVINVSLEGAENGTVFVKCTDDHGLAFFNAINLTISNITFTNCGLSGSQLSNFVAHLKGFMELQYYIPDVLKVGLLIVQCVNLMLENVVVANTMGIGMIGVNILGQSKINHSTFVNNTSPNCGDIEAIPLTLFSQDSKLFSRIGGGLFLLYQDVNVTTGLAGNVNTSLSIEHSWFFGNSECSYSAYTSLNYQYFRSAQKLRYIVGGGGGLSIFAVQTRYNLLVDVLQTTFTRNLAVYGSGVHIGLFVHSLFNSIKFKNCSFHKNGRYYAKGGAGIAVFFNLYDESSLGKRHHCMTCKVISILDSNFTKNYAVGQGGGVLAYSLANQAQTNYFLEQYNNIVALRRCYFVHNIAKYGSSLYASQRVTHGLDGLFGILVEDVTMTNNSETLHERINTKTIDSNFAANIDLRSVNLVVESGSLTVEGSGSSGFSVWSSVILMKEGTTVNLKNNRATEGGGMLLVGYTPTIILSGNCTLNFTGNRASIKGGAVLFYSSYNEDDDLYPLNAGDCFLFGSDIYTEKTNNILTSNNTIIFSNNEAPLGSIIYGSSLKSCPWAAAFSNGSNSSGDVMLKLNNMYNSTFAFTDLEIRPAKVSSEPKSLRIHEDSKLIKAYPGGVTDVFLDVQDIFDKNISTVIVADYWSANPDDVLSFDAFMYKRESNSSIQLKIPSNVHNESVVVTLYTENNLIGDTLTIEVKECPFGFAYDPLRTSSNCQCDNSTNTSGVYCNVDDVSITVEGDTWLGCLEDPCTEFGKLVVQHCLLGYCNPNDATFDLTDTSNQCNPGSNRTGVMCGRCADGYSITFGSICKHCDVRNLDLLAYSMLDTIVVFFLLCLVGLTIDKEWSNILFFFCTIAFPYKFLGNEATYPLKKALYVINAINHDRYGNSCMFFGLQALGRSGLSILYPLYLLVLMLVFAIVCRYSSFMSKHFSPAKTMMTMTYLLYIATFQSSSEILAPLPLWSIDRSVFSLRWAIDPNVQYGTNIFHGLLVITSLTCFTFYLIPGCIALLFPTKMYMHFKRFYPFLDIIWAPFKTKCRPWASVRLLFSVAVVTVARFFSLSVTLPITICSIGTFLFIQTSLQPFKSRLANVLDSFFLFMAQVMHFIGYLLYVYEGLNSIHDNTRSLNTVVGIGIFILAVSYATFFVTFIWYWREFFKSLFEKLKKCYRKVSKVRKRSPHAMTVVEVPSNSHSHHTLSIPRYSYPDYSKYRESILAD